MDDHSARLFRLFGGRRGVGDATGEVPVVLAPMARASHLPLRLLALRHGATAVFSDELLARQVAAATRVENAELGTVDFVLAGASADEPKLLLHRTCALERERVVAQLGTSNAMDAAQAAVALAADVAGVDINMGCPDATSVSGGMGSALLAKPEVAANIISEVRKALPAESLVTCKIRLLDTVTDTVNIVRVLEKAGASAIVVHARRTQERPREPARWQELAPIVDSISIPVVANGDVFTRRDADRLARMSGAASCMAARGAIADASLPFARSEADAYRSTDHFVDAYMSASALCGNAFAADQCFLTQVERYRKDRSTATCIETVSSARDTSGLLDAYGLPKRLSPSDCWSGIRRPDELATAEQWNRALDRALDIVVAREKQASPALPSLGESRGLPQCAANDTTFCSDDAEETCSAAAIKIAVVHVNATTSSVTFRADEAMKRVRSAVG